MTMKVLLKIADLVFSVTSERDLYLEENLKLFMVEGDTASAVVTVRYSWKPELFRKPSGIYLGEDLLHTYYAEPDNILLCMTKGGYKGMIGSAAYDRTRREVTCVINEKPFLFTPRDLGALLRYLPLFAIYQDYGILFFHASQVAYRHTGILFTAPSGGGKTTQAGLWVDNEQAKLICNDRTYLRYKDGWYTYGCPVDGSAPVCSTKVNPLGCLVVLKKTSVNQVRQLHGKEAILALLPQLIFDYWEKNATLSAVDRLNKLTETIPVYELQGTPDKNAVICLKEQLQKDGVLTDGKNQ